MAEQGSGKMYPAGYVNDMEEKYTNDINEQRKQDYIRTLEKQRDELLNAIDLFYHEYLYGRVKINDKKTRNRLKELGNFVKEYKGE